MGIPLRTLKLHGLDDTYVVPARNLLDNSDFTNPVNQRGQQSYLNFSGYCIDRWKLGNATESVGITLVDGCIKLFSSSAVKCEFVQMLENFSSMVGKKYTFAFEHLAGTRYAIVFTMGDEEQYSAGNVIFSSLETQHILVSVSLGYSATLKWVALYEGEYTVDTLPEYQPKGYAEEMAVCAQYNPETGDYIGLVPESIGAAPAGYGLGETAKLLTNADDLNNVWKPGWYRWGGSAPVNAPTIILTTPNYTYMRVDGYNETSFKQTLVSNYIAGYGITITRQKQEGVVGAWEYENPPMVTGTEYRTTERWNGKAVYTALVSMGNLPNATTKSVSVPGDKVATNIVRFNAIATLSGKFAYDMMCLSGVTRVEFRYGTDSNVYMNVATNTDMSAYSGTFQLWYTKD